MKPLKPVAFEHAGSRRMQFRADVPAGTTLSDVMTPAFWSNCVGRVKAGSTIEVLSEDYSLDCELRVLEVGQTFLNVRLLRQYAAPTEPVVVAQLDTVEGLSAVEVSFGGKEDRWRVVHEGKVVERNFATKTEADKAAEAYRKKLAA